MINVLHQSNGATTDLIYSATEGNKNVDLERRAIKEVKIKVNLNILWIILLVISDS
jgi:hypothetical protein